MQSFEDVRARLDEIVQAVSDDELPLDDALNLYEEAVSLGLRVSDLIEVGIDADSEEEGAPEAADPEVADGEAPANAPAAATPAAPAASAHLDVAEQPAADAAAAATE
ncbi:MAG TPA: exodeoxyribonuclease VII small subunit [Eggerthellaceae bacterium]|nr:exodeoxyribonuclease VII small subunit [Eggerthellaceae bacterium]